MAKTEVNKVGAGTTGSTTSKKDKKDKKKKAVRIDFPIADAMYRNDDKEVVTAVNGDGLLIAVPVPLKDDEGKIVYAGFKGRKHNPLKKNDFASIAGFIRFQAHVARMKAITFVKSAEEKEAKADRIEQFGDESTRKKAQKVARMREQLAILEAGLKEEGVDISKL